MAGFSKDVKDIGVAENLLRMEPQIMSQGVGFLSINHYVYVYIYILFVKFNRKVKSFRAGLYSMHYCLMPFVVQRWSFLHLFWEAAEAFSAPQF